MESAGSSQSVTTPHAPRSSASRTKTPPSAWAPLRAKNKSPGSIDLESQLNPLTPVMAFPVIESTLVLPTSSLRYGEEENVFIGFLPALENFQHYLPVSLRWTTRVACPNNELLFLRFLKRQERQQVRHSLPRIPVLHRSRSQAL